MANFPVTLTNKQSSFFGLPTGIGGFTHRFKIKAADVAVAGATGSTDTVQVSLGRTPGPYWMVDKAFAVINTVGAGTTALTMQVGTTTTPSAFIAATSVLSGSHIQAATGINTVNTPASSFGTTDLGIQALFTNATGGSPSALTGLDVDIYLSMRPTQRLDGTVGA